MFSESRFLGMTGMLNHGMLGLEIYLRNGDIENQFLIDFRNFLSREEFKRSDGIAPEGAALFDSLSARLKEMAIIIDNLEKESENSDERAKQTHGLIRTIQHTIADVFSQI